MNKNMEKTGKKFLGLCISSIVVGLKEYDNLSNYN